MTRVALLLRKDALILRRSPLLLGLLLSYPLVIALLVGLVAGYANAKPRVALVDGDGLLRYASPWTTRLREAAWLCGLGALFGFLARMGTRRLLA
jgi:hypothetical protein